MSRFDDPCHADTPPLLATHSSVVPTSLAATHSSTVVAGLCVGTAEAGCKLLSFLERHCAAPSSDMHRWIRTGQVRLNGGRTKPFVRLAAGDVVRVPPFARVGSSVSALAADAVLQPAVPLALGTPLCFTPPLAYLAVTAHVFVCVKPAGLPVHGGTGHQDSLIARLRAQEPDAPFPLTPAHRLDKATSGLLLVARSYTGLQAIHEALTSRTGLRPGLRKSYFAWVQGHWPTSEPQLLEDWLIKQKDADGRERMRTVPAGTLGADAASLTVRCISQGLVQTQSQGAGQIYGQGAGQAQRQGAGQTQNQRPVSLLEIALHTGRTHQIRIQLASRGFALIGDRKYGGPACAQGMLLHAAQLECDPELAAALALHTPLLRVLPEWPALWAVTEWPKPYKA